MPSYQNIFLIFFTIYFAITTNITGKLHPFDTPSMFKGYHRAWLRFAFALFLLNAFPIVFFWATLKHLEIYNKQPTTLGGFFLLFFASLIGQGIYRVFYGCMLIKHKNRFVFYDEELYQFTKGLPTNLYKDLNDRPENHKDIWGHIIPGLIFIAISIMSAYLIPFVK